MYCTPIGTTSKHQINKAQIAVKSPIFVTSCDTLTSLQPRHKKPNLTDKLTHT